MPANFTLDQAGLPAGTLNTARNDGLATGAQITITTTEAGTVELVDVPVGETNTVPTVTGNPLVWVYTPTVSTYGTYLFRLTVGVDTNQYALVVLTPVQSFTIPGWNEVSDTAGLIQTAGSPQVVASNNNVGGNVRGWAPALSELILYVDGLAAGTPTMQNAYDGGSDWTADGTENGMIYTALLNNTPALTIVGAANVLTDRVLVLEMGQGEGPSEALVFQSAGQADQSYIGLSNNGVDANIHWQLFNDITGDLSLATGVQTGATSSGDINLTTGDSSTGSTGSINLTVGDNGGGTAGTLNIAQTSGNGNLRLLWTNNYVGLIAPNNPDDTDYELPATRGTAGQVLAINTAAAVTTLEWVTQSGGSGSLQAAYDTATKGVITTSATDDPLVFTGDASLTTPLLQLVNTASATGGLSINAGGGDEIVFPYAATTGRIVAVDGPSASNPGTGVTVQAGAGNTTGVGGALLLAAGAGGLNAAGGDVTVLAGNAGGDGTGGGDVILTAGDHGAGSTIGAVIVSRVSGEPIELQLIAGNGDITGFVAGATGPGTVDLMYVMPVDAPTVGQVLAAAAPSGGRSILSWDTPAGAGDVVGPGSATDEALARFDLATGKLIQNSVILVTDAGAMTGMTTVDGRDLAVDGSKLDGIEALADVTDATNVAAAGAVMDSEMAGTYAGSAIRTGSATYAVLKHNLAASVAPAITDDSASDYAVGSDWIDTTANNTWRCVDASVGAAVWKQTDAAAGGGHTMQAAYDGGRTVTATAAGGGGLLITATANTVPLLQIDTAGGGGDAAIELHGGTAATGIIVPAITLYEGAGFSGTGTEVGSLGIADLSGSGLNAIILEGVNATTTDDPTYVAIRGGTAVDATGGTAGAVGIGGGASTGTADGGAISITGGASTGTGDGGTVTIASGDSTTGTSGAITLDTPSAPTPGDIDINAGNSSATGALTVVGGAIDLGAGTGNAATGATGGAGGAATFSAGTGGTATAADTPGAGGDNTITAGNAGTGGAADAAGGRLFLFGGDGGISGGLAGDVALRPGVGNVLANDGSILIIRNTGGRAPELRWQADNLDITGFVAGATGPGGDVVYVLPVDAPTSGQVLSAGTTASSRNQLTWETWTSATLQLAYDGGQTITTTATDNPIVFTGDVSLTSPVLQLVNAASASGGLSINAGSGPEILFPIAALSGRIEGEDAAGGGGLAGVALALTAGAGDLTASGGAVDVVSGAGGATGGGGTLTVAGGAGGSTSGNGGDIQFLTGSVTSGIAGDVDFVTPNSAGANRGGNFNVALGQAGTVGIGGSVDFELGLGGSTSGAGGGFTVTTGDAGGSGVGGPITLVAGTGATGIGGTISATAGNGDAATGGAMTFTAGDGGGVGHGGASSLIGGTGGTTGDGGAVSLTGGAGGATSGEGGAIAITAGAGTAGNSIGGASAVIAGAGQGTAAGGLASLTGGAGGATGAGGAVSITGGAGGATSGNGGSINLIPGDVTSGTIGAVVVSLVNATAPELQLIADNSDITGFVAGATGPASTDLVYVMPVDAPTAGQVLSAAAPSGGRSVLSWDTAAGAGDVTGPGSSTDNALARWNGTGGDTLDNSSATLDDGGALTLNHTASEADDSTLTLIVDAAGFGDVKGIDVDYITGTISAGEDEEVVLLNIDESASTGGRVVGLEVLATDAGSSEVDGLEAGAGVHPVFQLSGSFADADTVLVLAVDQTTALSGGGAGNITVFVADNDTVTVGSASTYQELEFLLDTAASTGVQPTFEFSTGVGTWTAFTPTDGTNGFLNTGVVAWALGDIPTWAVGTGSEYLIRITRTRNGSITSPIVDLVQVADAIEYKWDKDALITAKAVNLSAGADPEILFPIAAVAGRIEGEDAVGGGGLAGVAIAITGGAGDLTAAGGAIEMLGGTGGATGAGAHIELVGGVGGATSGAGGDIDLLGGLVPGSSGAGGSLTFTGGNSKGASVGGGVQLDTGVGGATGAGGAFALTSGDGGSTSGAGGAFTVTTGDADGSGTGGAFTVTSGAGASGVGGPITLTAGAGNAAAGGLITLTTGAGNGANAGGALALTGGAGGATGAGAPITLTGGAGGSTSGAGGSISFVPGNVTSGTIGAVVVERVATTAAELQLVAGNGDLTGFVAGATGPGVVDTVYVLPVDAPTVGQVLSAAAPSGGRSILSWDTAGAASFDVISPTALAAQTNNYNPTDIDGADMVRITLTGDQTLTGIDSTGVTDERKIIANVDTVDTLTLGDEHSSSTAANRFDCPGNADYAIGPGDAAEIVWDTTSSRWRVIGPAPGAGDTIHTVTDAATVTFDGDNGTIQQCTITAHRALAVANLVDGERYLFRIRQDSTAHWTPIFGDGFQFEHSVMFGEHGGPWAAAKAGQLTNLSTLEIEGVADVDGNLHCVARVFYDIPDGFQLWHGADDTRPGTAELGWVHETGTAGEYIIGRIVDDTSLGVQVPSGDFTLELHLSADNGGGNLGLSFMHSIWGKTAQTNAADDSYRSVGYRVGPTGDGGDYSLDDKQVFTLEENYQGWESSYTDTTDDVVVRQWWEFSRSGTDYLLREGGTGGTPSYTTVESTTWATAAHDETKPGWVIIRIAELAGPFATTISDLSIT